MSEVSEKTQYGILFYSGNDKNLKPEELVLFDRMPNEKSLAYAINDLVYDLKIDESVILSWYTAVVSGESLDYYAAKIGEKYE